jgi:phosphoribosylglycinamide formyltransferase 2
MEKTITIGTPLSNTAKKAMLLGSGELGKEVAIEFQRLGVEVIAVDRYANAPAMQVAHRSYVVSMLDGDALATIIRTEKPDYIVPEVEAIATDTLIALEAEGFTVIPTAKATWLTMNREGIRSLAAKELQVKTSPFEFAGTYEEFEIAVAKIGIPCVIKPIMSSSGKGQSVIKKQEDILTAWDYAQQGGRSGKGRVIIEGFVDFDYEITLLTIKHQAGISFCAPIGHRQEHGDYQESWQPHPMSENALKAAQDIASKVVNALGGKGLFGVEFFVKGDEVYFSELSPRPHDTGMVTLAGTQNFNEFELHLRAILSLPIFEIKLEKAGASAVILASENSLNPTYEGFEKIASLPKTDFRIFGKPTTRPYRRMAVALVYDAIGTDMDELRKKVKEMADLIGVV